MAGELAVQMARPLPNGDSLMQLVVNGDLRVLNSEQKAGYYSRVCESLGLNPLTQPFAYIVLNGKEQLYAKKDATEQLRRIYGVTVVALEEKQVGDAHVVKCRVRLPDGREDISTGAVAIANLKGEALANSLMKCETKAKRRATLSICGLGFLDESEVETIQHVQPAPVQRTALPPAEPKPQAAKPATNVEAVEAGKPQLGAKAATAIKTTVELDIGHGKYDADPTADNLIDGIDIQLMPFALTEDQKRRLCNPLEEAWWRRQIAKVADADQAQAWTNRLMQPEPRQRLGGELVGQLVQAVVAAHAANTKPLQASSQAA